MSFVFVYWQPGALVLEGKVLPGVVQRRCALRLIPVRVERNAECGAFLLPRS